MSRLRLLLLAPSCDPEAISIPFVSYCHAAALAKLHDVTLVVGSAVEGPVRRAEAPFRTIEVVRTPILDRVFDWGFRTFLRSNYDTQLLTAIRIRFLLPLNGSRGGS